MNVALFYEHFFGMNRFSGNFVIFQKILSKVFSQSDIQTDNFVCENVFSGKFHEIHNI